MEVEEEEVNGYKNMKKKNDPQSFLPLRAVAYSPGVLVGLFERERAQPPGYGECGAVQEAFWP